MSGFYFFFFLFFLPPHFKIVRVPCSLLFSLKIVRVSKYIPGSAICNAYKWVPTFSKYKKIALISYIIWKHKYFTIYVNIKLQIFILFLPKIYLQWNHAENQHHPNFLLFVDFTNKSQPNQPQLFVINRKFISCL